MTLPRRTAAADGRPEQISDSTAVPICVDLDGTLVRTDTLVELVIKLLCSAPWSLLSLIAVLLQGKAQFKNAIGRKVALREDSLPYNEDLLQFLRSEVAGGRRVLLVTGADSSVAIAVSKHLGVFDTVVSSDGQRNVVGHEKLAAIRRALNNQPFWYAGDSKRDLEVWRESAGAILVGTSSAVDRAVRKAGIPIRKVFPSAKFSLSTVFRAMRIHQWVKNALVLIPIVTSHRLLDVPILVKGGLAFLAFSLCASALYLVNDVLDLQNDRNNPVKRHRPVASGRISILQSLALAAILLASSLLITPGGEARLILAGYGVAVVAYSTYFKRLLMLDVIVLSSFYTLRLLYGGAATGIPISIWTLAFSMFAFLSLALVKRISELRLQTAEPEFKRTGRAYQPGDVSQLSALCSASSYVSALVLILYVNSPEVARLYSRPRLLFLIFPLLVYWLSRTLIIANRGTLNQDPVIFALTDRSSQCIAVAVLAILAISM